MGTYKAKLAWADADALQLRIGVDPIERLEWALRFAETDAAQLTAADRDIERWLLALFAATPIFWWERLPTNYQLLREKFGRSRQPNGQPLFGAWEMEVPDDELVADVRQGFQKILTRLRTEDECTIPVKSYYVISRGDAAQFKEPKDFHPPLYFEKRKDDVLSRAVLVGTGGFQNEAIFRFAELLAGHHGALRICAETKCSRWFVSRNANQNYCSAACQSRATSRMHRERKAKLKT